MRKIELLFIALMMACHASAQTLDELQQWAIDNYPLVRQYQLIELSRNYTLVNIKKRWLPQVSASAQVSYQNEVTALPEVMKSGTMLGAGGMKGMGKTQYRMAIDVSQTLYDGGCIDKAAKVAKAQSDMEHAQAEVNLYPIRRRVNDLFFGILLLDEQLKVNHDIQLLYESNIRKLNGLVNHGAALSADVDAMRAELMNARQQATELTAMQESAKQMLSLLCGHELGRLSMPDTPLPTCGIRPELKQYDANKQYFEARRHQLDAALLPTLNVFAGAFYGYPGYNLFEGMMNRNSSLNAMLGVRIAWSIDPLYTRSNDRKQLAVKEAGNETLRQTFVFNNRLEQKASTSELEKFTKLLAQDEEIVSLRQNVRQATEAKLAHGIINVDELVNQITKENTARNNRAIHRIEMLSEMYNLKYITGK